MPDTPQRKTRLYGSIDPRLLHSLDGNTLTEVTQLTAVTDPETWQLRQLVPRSEASL